MATKKITLAQVCDFINENAQNAEALRQVRDLCKKHLKDGYAAAKVEREDNLAAWKAEQDTKPLMADRWTDSKGKEWIILLNSYRFRDAIVKAFPKAFYARGKKCWMVSADMAKEVDKFVLKVNKENKL